LPEGTEALGIGFEQATALVDPSGTFELFGVPQGRYTLDGSRAISHLAFGGTFSSMPMTPGLVSEIGAFMEVPSASDGVTFGTRQIVGDDHYSARIPVTVGSEDVSDLTAFLQPDATISGRIVREDGKSLPRTVVASVEPADGDATLGGPASDRNANRNPSGSFAISGLRRGKYFLRVLALPGLLVKSIVADGDFTNQPFDASTGADITDVLVTLTDRPATLSGMVRDRQGAQVREAAVVIFPTETTQWTQFGLAPPRIRSSAFFGDRGYRVERLPAGDYYAVAVDAAMHDSWKEGRFFAAAAPLAARVKLAWGEDTVQDLVIQRVILK
jgi:hypothetical protein